MHVGLERAKKIWLGILAASVCILLYSLLHSQWVVTALAAFLCAMSWVSRKMVAALHADVSLTHRALGGFIRGMVDERVSVSNPTGALSLLQHRINNVMDIMDYGIRGDDAGFDTSESSDYLQKIRATGLHAHYEQMKHTPLASQAPEIIHLPGPSMKIALGYSANSLAMLDGLSQKITTMQHALVHMKQHIEQPNVQEQGVSEDVCFQGIADVLEKTSQALKLSGKENDAITMQLHKGGVILRSLTETTESIENVIEMIHEVAGQTDMLALNATIEAARAGDAGRGFSVVASEVKNLAHQTSKASEMVKEKVGEMQAIARDTFVMMQEVIGHAQSASNHTELATTLDQQRDALHAIASQEQTPQAASSDLPAETLDILLGLAASMLKDVQDTKAESDASQTEEAPVEEVAYAQAS